jgi:hypothetical protein
MATRVNHQEIVKKLIDTKAIDLRPSAQRLPKSGPRSRWLMSRGRASAARCASSSVSLSSTARPSVTWKAWPTCAEWPGN